MGEERKTEKKKPKIQSTGDNEHMPVKWKGNGTIWKLTYIYVQAMEVGTRGNSLSFALNLQKVVAVKIDL